MSCPVLLHMASSAQSGVIAYACQKIVNKKYHHSHQQRSLEMGPT
jgi:hypothetical protein